MRDAAFFIASQNGSASTGVLSALLRNLGHAFRVWNSRRRLRRLSELDDHMLADVGLRREDIRWALHLPFSYEPALELRRRMSADREHGWRS